MSETIGGRYRLEEQLGAGGMAAVWLAHDTQLDRQVALKLLGADADPIRFEREAQAVASLSHPNICRLFDYGSEDGRPYMVFEHLPGGTLEERLAAGEPLDDAAAGQIAEEVAAGLAHAHDRGLIHRDLKPMNVVFDEEGHAKITDFGIARVSGADTLTEAGTLMGTAAYMSPEQASGEPVTPASDVYSFGVLLYRMLTGRLPFESASPVDLLRRQLHEEAEPVEAIRPDAPPALASVAEQSLAKDPAARPPDGRALVDLLHGDAAPTLVAEAPADVTRVLGPAPPDRRRVPLALLIAIPLLLAAGIVGAILATRGDSSGSSPTTTARTTTPSTEETTTQQQPPPPPPAPPPPPPPPRRHRRRHHLRHPLRRRLRRRRRHFHLHLLCRPHRLFRCRRPRPLPARLQRVISVVVPVHDEERSVALLYEELESAFEPSGEPWEAVFVDDGSTDGTFAALTRLHARTANTKVVRLRRNFGKSAALAAGFAQTQGDVIVTIDGDLQDDPAEIPRLLAKLDEGFDLVSGWKAQRRDPWRRRMLSRIFNAVTGRVSGLRLHDMNCGLKAYRAEVVRGLALYGELHRFIPVLAHYRGYRVAELPVNHRPRQHGSSRYGLERYVRGFLDLLTVTFMGRYRHRPLHLFGGLGLILGAIGTAVLVYLTVLKATGEAIGQRPLLTLGVLLVVVGLQLFSLGLLSEMVTSHHEERTGTVDRERVQVEEVLS